MLPSFFVTTYCSGKQNYALVYCIFKNFEEKYETEEPGYSPVGVIFEQHFHERVQRFSQGGTTNFTYKIFRPLKIPTANSKPIINAIDLGYY
jgi:hypothetical protein